MLSAGPGIHPEPPANAPVGRLMLLWVGVALSATWAAAIKLLELLSHWSSPSPNLLLSRRGGQLQREREVYLMN